MSYSKNLLVRRNAFFGFGVLIGAVLISCSAAKPRGHFQGIQPSSENPWYWEYKGEPLMLFGANERDDTFLMPDVRSYLEDLKAHGGNYIRNVMSQREPDPRNRPHKMLENGRYDLDQWNERYWESFEKTLEICRELDIIVSIELWDKFDFWHPEFWPRNAWNPNNNVNFSFEDSGFLESYDPVKLGEGMGKDLSKITFTNTVPALDNNRVLLHYQHAFLDKLLSYSFKYPNIIYNVSNEWKESIEWPIYWATYVRKKAAEAGVTVQLTEMVWCMSNNFDDKMNFVIDRSDLFSFCGLGPGQVFTPHGEGQYVRIMEIRDRVEKDRAGRRPLNEVKVRTPRLGYSHSVHAQARVWRPLLAGWSALSTHRVHKGSSDLGFSDGQKANLKALRAFSDLIEPWRCEPRNDLLSARSEDEAYLLANPGQAYGIYFVVTGTVNLDLKEDKGTFAVQWINVETGELSGQGERIEGGQVIEIACPEERSQFGWAVAITR